MLASGWALTTFRMCRMYLQTKLANPHFKPEVAAQTTLVNFCVTEVGLEEQLLALVSCNQIMLYTYLHLLMYALHAPRKASS